MAGCGQHLIVATIAILHDGALRIITGFVALLGTDGEADRASGQRHYIARILSGLYPETAAVYPDTE